jgi:transcriptional regulator with XRE-family HTH domain
MSKPIHTAQSKRLRQLLVRYRKEAGLTQGELAARIDRPQTFVSKVEIGERRIDVIELIQMLSAMRADPVEFVAALIRRKL